MPPPVNQPPATPARTRIWRHGERVMVACIDADGYATFLAGEVKAGTEQHAWAALVLFDGAAEAVRVRNEHIFAGWNLGAPSIQGYCGADHPTNSLPCPECERAAV